MDNEQFDYIIIGGGPAGLSAAAELAASGRGSVLLLEKGRSFELRSCRAKILGRCDECKDCDLMSGLGGASGIIGGKLCFFPAGAGLASHVGATSVEANQTVLRYLSSIGSQLALHNLDEYQEEVEQLHLKHYFSVPILQPSLLRMFQLLASMIINKGGVIRTEADVLRISGGPGRFRIIYSSEGKQREALATSALVIATGRSGSEWLEGLLRELGVETHFAGVDVGVRLEFSSEVAHELGPQLQDAKFKEFEGSSYGSRTLCWCRGGELCATSVRGMVLVDGHFSGVFTSNTSVSIVSRVPMISGLDMLQSAFARFSPGAPVSGVLYQDLLSFMLGRNPGVNEMPGPNLQPFRATKAPIAQIMDDGLWDSVATMIERIDGVLHRRLLSASDAVVYGPVIDHFWPLVKTNKDLMTSVDGIYVAGDATGLARGIVQGLFSGLTVANSIIRRSFETSKEMASLKF